MAKMTVQDVDVTGKRVLVRVDFNVPITEDGKVGDDKRITAALPTIQYLLDHKAKVILCSHLGRPKGKFDPQFSLAPVGARLSELLPDVRVWMADDVIGESAKTAVADMKEGEIVLLENVRFHAEEEANDPAFAKELASLAELYVSDAFGTVHRAHASTAGRCGVSSRGRGLLDWQGTRIYRKSAGRSRTAVCRHPGRRESCR